MGVEDKASNQFKDTKGKVKEGTGKVNRQRGSFENEGNRRTPRRGLRSRESVESLKDAAGNVKDAFKK